VRWNATYENGFSDEKDILITDRQLLEIILYKAFGVFTTTEQELFSSFENVS